MPYLLKRANSGSSTKMRIACMGEVMGEFSGLPSALSIGVGGDTFNSAVYLARSGVDCSYVSAVGSDPFGKLIRHHLVEEGISDALLFEGDRETGLYAITTSSSGERSFHYWRERSAVRSLLRDHGAAVRKGLSGIDMLYVTGVTLYAFFDEIDLFLDLLKGVSAAGIRIIFDGNFRPRLWSGNRREVRALFDRVVAMSEIVLPSAEDEAELHGDSSPEDSARRLLELGPQLAVVKMGGDGCLVATRDTLRHVAVPHRVDPFDTTAAGDSFNAAFLASLLAGASEYDAALAGHELAGRVVQHPGALLPL